MIEANTLTDEFNADPTRTWDTSLSERHEQIDADLDIKLDAFVAGDEYNPLAVVGPYGAGKTQFLYEVLRRGWSRNIPALYTDLKTILDAHEDTDEPIVEWIERKTTEEIEKLQQGKRSNWLPDFRYSDREDQFYEEFIQDSDVSTEKRILLIDEVEQKYEKLNEYMGVDDTNPLRDILDNLTDIFQVWSFGLVSAYEVIGEADRRRFDEVRIPITEVDTVWNQLKQNNKPPTMSNGLWWIARGRAGWISNHSSNLPDASNWTDDSFENWVDEASSHAYYGADSIAPVWGEKGVPAAEIRDAKRTVLFESPAYDDWTIKGTNAVIQVSNAHEVLFEAIRDQQTVKGDVFEIIHSNLLDVLRGFSPPSAWVTDGDEVEKMFLPSEAFSRPVNMEGLMNTVKDFISSFEKRGDDRKEATRILGELDTDSLSNTWSGLFNPLEKPEEYDVNVWTVRSPVVRDAYKPLALNPGALTDKETAELREPLTSPIRYDPQVSLEGASLDVQLCPTEAAFSTLCTRLTDKSDVTETTTVLLPDIDRADWDIPKHMERLTEHNLVSIEKVGGERLWDFIIQLNHYLDSNNYSGTLSEELIQETVIPDAAEDHTRNTINALFNELDRLVTDAARTARTAFTDAYTLPEIEGFLWQDGDLEGSTPYYGTSSGSDTPKHGLEYGLVFSERTIDADVPHQRLISGLQQAYNQDYETTEKWFRSNYFFNRSFEGDGNGITDFVQEVRKKYVTEGGQLRRPVRRLQKALVYLCQLNQEGLERIYQRVVNINTGNYSEEEELSVLRDVTAGQNQTEDLFRGLLMQWTLQENYTLLKDDLESVYDNLKYLDNQMDKVTKQVETLNKNLEPPVEIDGVKSIQLRESRISEYHSNIRDVHEGVEYLIDFIEQHPNVAPAVAVLWSIVDRYEPMMETVVNEFRTQLGSVELYQNIINLKSEYNALRQWSNRAEGLEHTQVTGSEIQSLVNELGHIIFDFPTRLGTTTVPIEEEDLIDTLDRFVQEDIAQLSQLNQRTDGIEHELEIAENLSKTISKSLLDFAANTSISGGQQ
ncbi:hypothetical protein [Halomicrococcus sp. SG-WS-1]|uniref:hypothetical protein n=1 Tax=Halomicrococcus sp. SG-WS-1 TaxID=3439057 RepID=UPI003F78F87E